MKKGVVVLCLISIYSSFSSAEMSKKQIVSCYDNTASKEEFIKCIDADKETIKTENVKNSKWEAHSSENELDDSKIYYAELTASSGKGKYNKPITLWVRCQSNKTEMLIDWNHYLGIDSTRIAFRVGSAKANTQNWTISTNHQASFYPGSPIKILKDIEISDKVIAQVTPYGENPVTAIFETAGAKQAFIDIRKSCKW